MYTELYSVFITKIYIEKFLGPKILRLPDILLPLLGQAFIPWALRVLSSQSQDANDGSASTSADQRPRKELKRTAIQKKLNKIVKVA